MTEVPMGRSRNSVREEQHHVGHPDTLKAMRLQGTKDDSVGGSG